MYFLIEYNRKTKELIKCTEYVGRKKAWDMHLEKTLKLSNEERKYIEIALFEADSRSDLEYTQPVF